MIKAQYMIERFWCDVDESDLYDGSSLKLLKQIECNAFFTHVRTDLIQGRVTLISKWERSHHKTISLTLSDLTWVGEAVRLVF